MDFYNQGVKVQAPSLLYRCLTLLLAGLLALGPFLHGHFGASHDTGFHLDGVHAVHVQSPVGMSMVQTGAEESPALGVGSSLPHPEDDGLVLLAVVLLASLLSLCMPTRRQSPPRPERMAPWARTCYRPGLPPPCLAPPTR